MSNLLRFCYERIDLMMCMWSHLLQFGMQASVYLAFAPPLATYTMSKVRTWIPKKIDVTIPDGMDRSDTSVTNHNCSCKCKYSVNNHILLYFKLLRR